MSFVSRSRCEAAGASAAAPVRRVGTGCEPALRQAPSLFFAERFPRSMRHQLGHRFIADADARVVATVAPLPAPDGVAVKVNRLTSDVLKLVVGVEAVLPVGADEDELRP